MHGGFCQFTILSVRTTEIYRTTGPFISREGARIFDHCQSALISGMCYLHFIHPKIRHRLHHDVIGYRIIQITAIALRGIVVCQRIISNIFMPLPLSIRSVATGFDPDFM
jgi:hypothetical protein